MTRFDSGRRKLLKASGAALTIAIAGCSGDDGGGNGNGNGNGNGDVPSEVDSYLSDANQYDGSVSDMTGQDSVTVDNGVGDASAYAYDPAAIRVDAGTEVTWEWASPSHSVTHEDEQFNSETQGEGSTFSHTFEDSGNYLYYCIPHKSIGQKGAVIVE